VPAADAPGGPEGPGRPPARRILRPRGAPPGARRTARRTPPPRRSGRAVASAGKERYLGSSRVRPGPGHHRPLTEGNPVAAKPPAENMARSTKQRTAILELLEA